MDNCLFLTFNVYSENLTVSVKPGISIGSVASCPAGKRHLYYSVKLQIHIASVNCGRLIILDNITDELFLVANDELAMNTNHARADSRLPSLIVDLNQVLTRRYNACAERSLYCTGSGCR